MAFNSFNTPLEIKFALTFIFILWILALDYDSLVDFIIFINLLVLAPRTKLLAVPYAVQAQFTEQGASLWSQSGTTLTSPGRIGVGQPTPSAQLHITNNQSQVSLLKVDDVSDTRMVVQADGSVGGWSDQSQ